MTDQTLSTLLTVLVVITFVVASAALVSLARVEYLYRKHAQRVKPEIRSVVLVRQRRGHGSSASRRSPSRSSRAGRSSAPSSRTSGSVACRLRSRS
jgi:uncharacterized membrane protein YgcG